MGRPLKILEGAEKADEWAKFRGVTSNIDERIAKTDVKAFVMGNGVSWANFFLSALSNILGEDSEE